MASLLAAALDFIFPSRCVHCFAYAGAGRALCAWCARALVPHRTFFCGKCHTRRYSPHGGPASCHRDFPYTLGAAGEYADPVLRNLIHALKFGFVRAAADPLATFISRYADRSGLRRERFDLIVPIPLSRRRRNERGFNQAELIAVRVGRSLRIPVAPSLLTRTRHTSPQSALPTGPARRRNVARCFTVTDPRRTSGARIILLDDVVTSGATMSEAAAALRNGGAANVLALAAAKAS